MKYESERELKDIAPLLERLDRGEMLTREEEAELAAIRVLDGSRWEQELPASIATLTGLQWLDLDNSQVQDLSLLSNLKGLQMLRLNNTRVQDLSALAGLEELQLLDLSDTLVEDLAPLSDLKGLQRLEFDNTQVHDLTPLSGLKGLQELWLSGTRVHDLSPLFHLKGLQLLDLDDTKVEDLSPLSGMKGLQNLYLENTQVQDLSPLSGLNELFRLSLSGTRVHDLRPICSLPKIADLDLRSCELREIQRPLAERFSNISFAYDWEMHNGIYLGGATLSTQPISIFREGPDVIREYYDAPKTAVRESKVIFLGDGGAGKTHTMKRILAKGDDTRLETDTTLGIAIQPYVAHEGEENEFKINFWDFGGQENMHAMHRCFLTERTLYVVVISNRWNLDQQARYWLDNIRSFAPKAPVILALNQWEGIREFGLDTNRLQKDYPNLLPPVVYTAKGGSREQFASLTECIVNEAEKLDSCAMELPEDWAAILQELRQMAAQEVGDDYKGHIDRSDYLALCEKHGLGGVEKEAVRTWLLEWFNDLGVCFSYHRDKHTRAELDSYKVLSPKWLTSAIYILLNHADLTVDNGCVTHSEIRKTLKHPWEEEDLERKDQCDYILPNVKYSSQECGYILQVMRKFGLSYQVEGKEMEFIPALCGGEMPKDLHPSEYSGRISYEFRYSFLPDSVVQRLMVRLSEEKRFSRLWNRGFRIDSTEEGLVTVVDGGGSDDKLRIDIYSTKNNTGQNVMTGLIAKIAAINSELNLKPEEFVIVQGNRGEFVAPADMILRARDAKLKTIHLYSRENGLVEQDVNRILGDTYGELSVKAAEAAAEVRNTGISEMMPVIIHQHNYFGSYYQNNTPEGLVDLLGGLAEKNIMFSEKIMGQLIRKLESSGEEGKKLAENANKAGKQGFVKTLCNGVKNFATLISGAKTVVEDSPVVIEAAKSAVDAIWPVLLANIPDLVQTAPEVVSNIANNMR